MTSFAVLAFLFSFSIFSFSFSIVLYFFVLVSFSFLSFFVIVLVLLTNSLFSRFSPFSFSFSLTKITLLGRAVAVAKVTSQVNENMQFLGSHHPKTI